MLRLLRASRWAAPSGARSIASAIGACPPTIKAIQANAEKYMETSISIQGWVKSSRKQKQCTFVTIDDGSNMTGMQVVIPHTTDQPTQLASIGTGTSVRVCGIAKPSLGGKQTMEVVVEPEDVQVIGACDGASYPLQKKRMSLDTLRQKVLNFRGRTNTGAAVLRLRHSATRSINNFFDENGFIQVHTPVLTSSDCEGAGELFQVVPKKHVESTTHTKSPILDEDYFTTKAFLTVSGQLHAECFACSMSRVYSFGPTFRAEDSNTTRHLAEFWMLEPEVAFTDLDGILNLAEHNMRAVCSDILRDSSEDVKFFNRFYDRGLEDRLRSVESMEKPFHRITYREALHILENCPQRSKFEFPVTWETGLFAEHEKYLCEHVFDGLPVFVTNFPKDQKPFYMKVSDEDPETVEGFDLLLPKIGELIGGSVREHRLDQLKKNMQSHDLGEDCMKWYADLREYGSVPHAGYGMGFERLILWLTGLDNIRDVIPMPRASGLLQY